MDSLQIGSKTELHDTGQYLDQMCNYELQEGLQLAVGSLVSFEQPGSYWVVPC